MLTTALDLMAVACLTAFAWFVWPPLSLAVLGMFCLAISWRDSR